VKYLIAGLGNIGAKYELTRHNVGFLILDRLAERLGGNFTPDRLAEISRVKFKGKQLVLVKPATYMNQSGKALNYWLQQEKINKQNLMVIADDIALPFGKIRIRAKGSDAGHNGLKNIEELLMGPDYPRLRFGIGDDFAQGQKVDFVLSNFNQQEFEALPVLMDNACEAILSFISIGLERTMNIFN
jgi:PTH1 family peptidyl-tRNA hydrolase